MENISLHESMGTLVMKKDPTVWVSLLLIALPWIIGEIMGMPRTMDDNSPTIFQVFFWLMFIGAIRATILWFQTLIHGIEHAKKENRVAVVLGHIFLGPIMSYLYYWDSCKKAKTEGVKLEQ